MSTRPQPQVALFLASTPSLAKALVWGRFAPERLAMPYGYARPWATDKPDTDGSDSESDSEDEVRRF